MTEPEERIAELAARRLGVLVAIAGALGFLLLGTLRFVYFYLHDVAAGRPDTMVPRLIDESTGAVFEALVFALWWWYHRRWLRGEKRRVVLLMRHLLAFVVVSCLHSGLMIAARTALFPLFAHERYDVSRLPMRFLSEMGNDVAGYVSLVAIVMACESYAELRRRAAAQQSLERELALVELELLRLQLQPHFLFNALNTIAATMYDDVAAADELITGLSALLRASVRDAARQLVPLADELALARHYVQMMGARFGDRVDVRFDVAPEAIGADVPSMLLQPLLENALQHGAPPAGTRSLVRVLATATWLETTIVVSNRLEPGFALPPSARVAHATHRSAGMGIALQATRRRLAILYPDGNARLSAGRQGDDFVVTVTLPRAARTPPRPQSATRAASHDVLQSHTA